MSNPIDEGSYMGKGNHKPGWMLRADPELAKKFKEIEDRKKKMNSLMKKYGGKTSDEIAKMKKEEASPMIKPPSNRFDNKKDAFAHAKKNGGKVYRHEYVNPRSGMKSTTYSVKEEAEQVDEASYDSLSLRSLHSTDPKKQPFYKTQKGREAAAKKNVPDLKSAIKSTLGKHPKPNLPEEVEQIDEISKKTLGSYVKKAAPQLATSLMTAATTKDIANAEFHGKRYAKRQKGINKAADKLAKEEVEQIDERNKENKRKKEKWEIAQSAKKVSPSGSAMIARAMAKQMTRKMSEEAEQIDEGGNYGKPYNDVESLKSKSNKELERLIGFWNDAKKRNPDQSDRVANDQLAKIKMIRAERMISKSKMKKEEVEQIDERGDYWHPDPEQDRKVGGRGTAILARQDEKERKAKHLELLKSLAAKKKPKIEEKEMKEGYEEDKKNAPFAGPYRKASEPRKDKYGNVIKPTNIAKHLAKKAMAGVKKEEVEQVQEVIGTTTGYSDSGPKVDAATRKAHQMRNVVTKGPRAGKITKAVQDRMKEKIKARMAKEEVEQIDEISDRKKSNYVQAAMGSVKTMTGAKKEKRLNMISKASRSIEEASEEILLTIEELIAEKKQRLTAKQNKHIDVVDDDKIDAKDFAKLRNMKK